MSKVKVAVTFLTEVMVTVQEPVPEHAPLQPVKLDPVAGRAVSVTIVPIVKSAMQVLPQSIPPTLEVTAPAPVPALDTLIGYACRRTNATPAPGEPPWYVIP